MHLPKRSFVLGELSGAQKKNPKLSKEKQLIDIVNISNTLLLKRLVFLNNLFTHPYDVTLKVTLEQCFIYLIDVMLLRSEPCKSDYLHNCGHRFSVSIFLYM